MNAHSTEQETHDDHVVVPLIHIPKMICRVAATNMVTAQQEVLSIIFGKVVITDRSRIQ